MPLDQGLARPFPLSKRSSRLQKTLRSSWIISKPTYSPYERYGLRVYTGHWWQNAYGGFLHPNKAQIDVGYLDWRFIQDVATCSNGILQGKWLVDGSGVKYMGDMVDTDAWGSAAGRAIMVSGIGTIIIPLAQAYEAAGLKMPEKK